MPPISGARRSLRRTRAHVGLGPATLVLYNVTTLYFETDEGDGIREPGFSKDADSRNGELWRRDQKKSGDGGTVIRGAGSRHKSTISS